jgi:hypothetical protein
MRSVVISTRDGLEMVSYFSLPLYSDPQGSGRPENSLPLILDVHGGPTARDVWGYDSMHQWLANRGLKFFLAGIIKNHHLLTGRLCRTVVGIVPVQPVRRLRRCVQDQR